MKLRILGDSLRLRLSQSEVQRFARDGRVEQTIRFGGDAQMTYALVHDPEISRLDASFAAGVMTVRMASTVARQWAESDQVSLTGEQTIEADASLALLVEKDFKCAIPRAGEEDYDGFEHPSGNC